MDSVPVEIVRLGLGIDDYVVMVRNVKRVLNISEDGRKRILSRADKELSDEVRMIAITLSEGMCHDGEFFREAGFKYANGPPARDCFITSVADYLLRNRDRICVRKI
jgi:hypothetical protein